MSIDGAGRRWTGVERGELDQGQHDGVRDVLAVSTAGMLVRRDVWEKLGGLEPKFGLFRDDIDFCWRAHAAGHGVVAVSEAVVYHAEAAARGLRAPAMADVRGRRLDRRNATYTLLANLPLLAMLRALGRGALATLVRALILLATKHLTAATDELAAFGDVLRAPGLLLRLRAQRAQGRTRVYRSVRRFQPRRVALRRCGEWLAALLSGDALLSDDVLPARSRAADGAAASGGDEDGELFTTEPGPVRRLLSHPGVLIVLVLAGIAVLAERSLLAAADQLGGGALVPAWSGASDLWAQYAAGWHPTGLGSDAGAEPYVGVLALLATLLLGKPWLAVAVLLLASVPLAGLTAYLAARAIVVEVPVTGRRARAIGRRIPVSVVRAWFAATYAMTPVATGAIAGGRLGTAVVIVLLPLIGLLAARMYGLTGGRGVRRAVRTRRARRAAWGTGLLLTVATAFVPLLWLLALAVGGLTHVAFGTGGPKAGGPVASGGNGQGRNGRTTGHEGHGVAAGRGRRMVDRNLLIALGVPPLLLFPWFVGLLRHPSRFLLEAGLHRPELVEAALPARSMLALDPGGPGTPGAWVMAGLLVVALLALPLRTRRTAVLVGWMLALFGLLVAILISATTVTKGADQAPAWPGVALLVAGGGVLLAATAAVQRAAEVLAGRHLSYRVGGSIVVLAALTTPVFAAASWVARGVDGPLTGVRTDAVPAFAASASRPRTLVLHTDPSGRVAYAVLRGTEPQLGEAELPTTQKARQRLDGIVARLATGREADGGAALARMGVQYLLVPTPTDDPLTRMLDAVPHLSKLGRTSRFALWRLAVPGGRLMLVDGGTSTPLAAGERGTRVRIPPGSATRTLLLAEPADGGWHARFNGAELDGQTVDGWAQAYQIPASGGEFELSRGMRTRQVWVWLQAAGVLAVGVLALPGGSQAELAAAGQRRSGRRHGQARDRADAAVDAVVDAAADAVSTLRRRARSRLAARTSEAEPRSHAPLPESVVESAELRTAGLRTAGAESAEEVRR